MIASTLLFLLSWSVQKLAEHAAHISAKLVDLRRRSTPAAHPCSRQDDGIQLPLLLSCMTEFHCTRFQLFISNFNAMFGSASCNRPLYVCHKFSLLWVFPVSLEESFRRRQSPLCDNDIWLGITVVWGQWKRAINAVLSSWLWIWLCWRPSSCKGSSSRFCWAWMDYAAQISNAKDISPSVNHSSFDLVSPWHFFHTHFRNLWIG